MMPAIERRRPILSRIAPAGAVQPAATGRCYDNPTCENSILPGRGNKVLQNSTVTQCYNTVGANGAWKGEAVAGHGESCYPLAGDGARGLMQREQLKKLG
jgi:hypothetical protein